ncbi:DNA/RNA polymerase [Delitschia confertaspora ATCC 74209]|uniref:DNA/RNA polymerase n=1 Tax=Delitschia confertaspora ATCC 74209 TaxID=1513339 RepID=A0A9P4JM44_9PLEO|nr:DNA/RNA polymerase [Delitschia confertaspora ATCC 74209]
MDVAKRSKSLNRQLDKIILHFDCFYASVFENETPALRSLPLAVQQKQIVVTCNYEARKRGLHKLQFIVEAKKVCPDVVIVLGEDLTRFRNASKELYTYLRAFSWNSKVERLGFDEVFMDVSDIIDYNIGLLNPNHLAASFFCLSQADPTVGFAYDASQLAGHAYPEPPNDAPSTEASRLDPLRLRLHLGSHLAQHLRNLLHTEKGYTCTVGISTNKLLAKLAGNVHKPRAQTTLLPPYASSNTDQSDNVTTFLDAHEIGKIPGIGFKLAQKLREYVAQNPPELDSGLVQSGTKEKVLVSEVRRCPGIGAQALESVLGAPGTPRGIGFKIWRLLNGVDDTEVAPVREVPKQISIEDTYRRLDTVEAVLKEMRILAKSLIRRMHIDLLEDDDDDDDDDEEEGDSQETTAMEPSVADSRVQRPKRWLAYPKTLRLSTRPRPPPNNDWSKSRFPTRISRSSPLPNFVFSLKDDVGSLAERLVSEALVPLFRRLHLEKSGWNLGLLNIAATNIEEAASDSKGGAGRNILKMFKRQDDVLKEWKVEPGETFRGDRKIEPEETGIEDVQTETTPRDVDMIGPELTEQRGQRGSEDFPYSSQQDRTEGIGEWEYDEEDSMDDETFHCDRCGAIMPAFAMAAHDRWHANVRGHD